jgi:Arc-like DNA binding domain
MGSQMPRKGKTRKTSTRFGSKVVSFNLRMPEELRSDLEKAAGYNNHSMNAEIVWRLIDHILMAKQQLAPPAVAYRKQFARVPSVAYRPPLSAEQRSQFEEQIEALEKTRRELTELSAQVAQLRAKIESVPTADKNSESTPADKEQPK